MSLQEKLKNYANDIIAYSKMRRDRQSNVILLNNLYNRLCANWGNVIPDLMINKMLDNQAGGEDVLKALIVRENNEAIENSVELFTKIYENNGEQAFKCVLCVTEG